jgi:carbon-monoxide dehydrogenase large subunit
MFSPENHTFPNGCHVCEVEIDPDTGVVGVVRYAVVDDVGTVINPLTLKGQIHGGVVQGLSQVLFERIEYDPESGQLLTGSFMDYCMPRADDVVVMNAIMDALAPLGVKEFDMPATGDRVWRAIRALTARPPTIK